VRLDETCYDHLVAKRYVIQRAATMEETMKVFHMNAKEADEVRALVDEALDHIERHAVARKAGKRRAKRGGAKKKGTKRPARRASTAKKAA
jgi:hypothetical protein